MPIVYDKLLSLNIPEVEHVYTEKDAILYAFTPHGTSFASAATITMESAAKP